jgi:hypothetical protein
MPLFTPRSCSTNVFHFLKWPFSSGCLLVRQKPRHRSSPRRDPPHQAKETALLVVSLLVDSLLAWFCPPRRPLLLGPFQDREILLVVLVFWC